MSPRFLLDTNVCIYIRRKRPPAVLERFRKLKPGEAALSVITYGELMFGAHKSVQRERAVALLEELTAFVPVLPLPADSGLHYGRVRADLEARGCAIGGNDLWIAAHALSLGAILVTNDEGGFSPVPKLKLENWAGSG